MTRDFNKQRRDDSRPSFRDRSSNNNGEERSSSYPARPRLNRETVDRAWESGAQQKHADYRTRSNNGQPPRNNWRNQQPSEYSSSQNGHGGNRPFNNRQEQYRDNPRSFERTHDDPNGPRNPRARSFGPNNTNRQPYDNNRPGERRPYDNARPGERRPYDNNRPGERRPYDNARPGERRPYDNNRPGERRPYDNARPGERRPYDNNRPGNRDERFQGQDRGRDNRRPDFERNERPFSNNRQGPPPRGQYSPRSTPDTRNPRWQSRTWTQREASPEEQQEHSSRASYNEQFEGDYERFNNNEERPAPRDTSHRGGKPEGRKPRPNEEEEKHVTRLPDGRVIKGPRPQQRQEARFWTEVKDDTDSLVSKIQPVTKDVDTTEIVEVDAAQDVDVDAIAPDTSVDAIVSDITAPDTSVDAVMPDAEKEGKPAKKPRTRSASATVRSRKTGDAKEKVRGVKGPRPSQRGYQWPTT